MQFQADILGVAVVRPKVTETTALGAAYLAGLAVGFWRDTAELVANWQVDRRFEPAMSRDQAAALTAGWDKAVARAMGWAVGAEARARGGLKGSASSWRSSVTSPEAADRLIEKGNGFEDSGDFEAALSCYREAVTLGTGLFPGAHECRQCAAAT